jgi:hypothetical protein
MKLMPLDRLDLRAVADIRAACGAESSAVMRHISSGESAAYRFTAPGATATVVLSVDDEEMLVEAAAGKDREGRLCEKLLPLIIRLARKHNCLCVRAHAKIAAAARLYRRLSSWQVKRNGEVVSFLEVA